MGGSSITSSNVGQIRIYNLIQSKKGEFILQQVWEKTYSSGITFLKYNKQNTTLSIGFHNGDIKILKIYLFETSEVTKNLVDEIGLIKSHKKPICGIDIDFLLGYMFSISSESKLYISEINYQSTIMKVDITNGGLLALNYNRDYNLLILSDSLGSLYFYNVSSPINPIKLQAIHSQFNPIISIKFEDIFCFLGTNQGETFTFKYSISNEGLNLKQDNSFYSDRKFTVVNACSYSNLTVVGLSNGSIAIYSQHNDYPECKIFIIIN